MNTTKRIKRVISMLIALVLVFGMLPHTAMHAQAASADNTIFFATDRHEESSKLNSLLQAMAYEPGLVVLGGDHVNNTNSGSLASITSEIQAVYPGVQTFYTYAAHDPNVTGDSSNPYAFARTGEYYEGADYYVYAVDQDDMQSASSAATASQNFIAWAETVDESKVIFVMCHMPIHARRGDNAGGATWMDALNEVGESHDVVSLWGHNHTGESSVDTSVYFVNVGGQLTPEGGSTGTINFTYMNAGYIKNGYASMVVVESDTIEITRYSTSGSATASYSVERRFATSHVWVETESVAATCTTDGYVTAVCSDCGETKTTVGSATGHSYDSEVVNGCTGSVTKYTCSVCGDSYSEQNPTETTYDQASALVEGESYVIVASNYALTYGSSVGKTSVTATDGSITSDVSDAMVWTYQNGMLYNSANGKYINVSSSSSSSGGPGGSNRPGGSSSSSYTITFSDSGASVSYSSSKLTIGSYKLYYSSNSGFSARSSGSTVTLYQVNEGYAATGDHTYEISATVEATCTTDGSVTYTCTACGDSYTETVAASGEHTYETVTVEATCAEDGSVTYTCAVCGDSYVEVIPATGNHAYETVTVEATCAEDGSVTYTCAVCGDSYVEVIPATGNHAYETVTVEATCAEDGSVTNTCAVCGDSYMEVIPATGEHDHQISATVAATCTEDGSVTYTCAVCGQSYVETVAALGHSYETVTVEATCTENGSVTSTCTVCGDSCTETIEALGHSYDALATESTCTQEGCIVYTCASCGDSYTEVIPATGEHAYAAVTVAPTCTEEGSVTYTCEDCGESYTESIAAVGHSHEAVVTEPTCTEGGYTTYTCTACGDSYVADETAALGHSHEAVVTESTCTEGGYTTYTCTACGDSYVADETAALGHSHEAVVTEPTCTESGYTTYTCTTCGDSYIADETAALGHSHEAVVTESTCTESGYTTYTCTACGDSYVAAETAALGHSYTAVEADGMIVYTCDHCGDSYSEAVEPDVTYEEASAFTSGESFVVTLYSNGKYYALSHANNTISVVEVTVTGGVITSEVTEDMLWTYQNSKLGYVSGNTTYYMNASSSGGWFGSSTLSINTSGSSVSLSSNRLRVGNYYLRYSNGSVSASRMSSSTCYIFQAMGD